MGRTLGRLKRRSEFLRVAAKGRKVAARGVVVQSLARAQVAETADGCGPGDQDPQAIRVGFTASRKVGSAVERNRARRRLRAAAAAVLPREGRGSHDYVLIARRATLTRPYADLLNDLSEALRRLGQRPGKHSGKKQSERPEA